MTDFPLMQYKPVEKEDVLPDIDAHGYRQGVYRGLIKPNNSRLRAALAAIAYERAKLAVVATTTSDDLVERLERARDASMKTIDQRPTQVLEAPKTIEAQE